MKDRAIVQELFAEVVRMPAGRLAELLLTADGPDGSAMESGGRRVMPGYPGGPAAGRGAGPSGYGGPAGAFRRQSQPAAGRGNLVRQAVTLLVHYPVAATAISADELDAVAEIERPGIPLLTELLAQLREDPAASTGAVLERWRDRPEHASLSKLAAAVCIAPDATGAAAELKSALNRLITEESPARRLDELMTQARDGTLSDAEKQELAGLLRTKGQVGRRPPAAK